MPNHVYLLRGTSEVYPVNIEGRFSRRVTRCLEGVIQRACGYLPLAATVADTIFCCHGGITPRVIIRTVERPADEEVACWIANEIERCTTLAEANQHRT
ncbi:hypothetical protein ANCDUO_19154 [Ancylostoma duodenale]|uniref:Serine/threonine specific protein phosphatases domain-containing protein n=1 Tax=Ancylostoma duodenale TaxID=51022 RepID=A0A0C2FVR4_9BILA|nr:hypothetical protein ANCDUO_19154 [Ancylostoma duodenale]